jgi:dolichyl-diphosphooligosaccharide--protein glycosyltransferase
MATVTEGYEFFLKGESGRSTRTVLRVVILLTIAAAAVSSRLFSVIRFESIIHEWTLGDARGD